MKIISQSTYYNPVVEESLPGLKQDVLDATGKNFRRISRFIQLALIVSARCVGDRRVPNNTAIYFGSGAGDLGVSIDVLERLYKFEESPKPLSFINSLSNASCFYVAQYLGLQGASNFISSRCFSFERILSLAFKEYRLGKVKTALVTTVDSCVLPLFEQRRRLAVEPDVALAEAAHSLFVGDGAADGDEVGEVLAIQHCIDKPDLLSRLTQESTIEHAQLAFGSSVSVEDTAFLTDWMSSNKYCDTVIPYRDKLSYYGSQSGAIFQYLASASNEKIVHINADESGRYCYIVMQSS